MTLDPNDLAARERREPTIEEFELAWKDAPQRIEEYLPREPDGALFRDLLAVELAVRRKRGEDPTAAEYTARFPQYAAIVAELFDQTSAVLAPKSDGAVSGGRFRVGTRIADRYVIVAKLGRGGMGEVYQVEDEALGQSVALKFLPEDRTQDPKWVEQLKQEVTLARSISHPHVCQVHDYQQADEGSFLVMAFAAGGSLVTQSKLRPSGRFAPEDVTAYARQLCDGLAAVHDGGLLHRDLKPGNILLDERGNVKIADFGLAAVAERLDPSTAGHGTWQYMAPEQLGEGVPTARSDLYSLGVILYELITGHRPFAAASREELCDRQVRAPARPADSVPNLDPLLDRAILRCLERDPRKRPASAHELKDMLPPLSPKKTRDEGATGELRPRVALALLAAALLVLFVHAALADRTMAFRQLPPAQDPDWLRIHAAQLASLFGATPSAPESAKPAAESSGFEWDLDRVKFASHQHSEAWHPTAEERSPLVYFWYRSSPVHHTPANRVTPTDPPLATPGMACVLLDLDGRLVEYHAVPARTAQAPAETRTRDEWRDLWERRLLEAAKLDPARFRRVAAHRRPPVYADDSWGLEEIGGTGKRAEFGVCDGWPVYFQVGEPFANGSPRRDRAEGENVEAQGQRRLASGGIGIALMMLTVAAASPVAYRNWRLGRADLDGALRVVALNVGVGLLGWVCITDHARSLHTERILLVNLLGIATFWSSVLFVCYLTVEPLMRRRWPERLSSWNRVLSGRLRDPLVGRDVLIGVLAGACVTLVLKALAPLLGTYYLISPVYEPLTPNVPPGLAFSLFSYVLLRTAGTFVLLLLLGLIFRREWPTLVALVAILTGSAVASLATYSDRSWVTWVGMGAGAALMVAVAVRFGWLATLAALFTGSIINVMPITLTPHAWYSGATVTAVAALVALAVYGFFVSLGNQRLLPDDL